MYAAYVMCVKNDIVTKESDSNNWDIWEPKLHNCYTGTKIVQLELVNQNCTMIILKRTKRAINISL